MIVNKDIRKEITLKKEAVLKFLDNITINSIKLGGLRCDYSDTIVGMEWF